MPINMRHFVYLKFNHYKKKYIQVHDFILIFMGEEIEVQSEIIKGLVKGMQLKFEFKHRCVRLSELPSYQRGNRALLHLV